MDQRWEKAGSQAQRLPSLSSFPQSFASPPGKNDIFAGWESRLFRKRSPTLLAPAQRSAHQTVLEGGNLQRLPLLSRIGDHCPHSYMTWYHKEVSYHLFPISGRRPTVCLWGLGLVGDQGGPAARLPLLSGSLDVVPLECGRLLLPGQTTPRGCAGCVLNWDSLSRLQ